MAIFYKTLYQIVAKSILSKLFTGILGKFKICRYKDKLAELLIKTATEYKQHFPANNSKIGTPFYESQYVLEALLKKYFFGIQDFSGIKSAIKQEKGILTPLESELKCFFLLLEEKINGDSKLKSLFIENEYKRETFSISAVLAQLRNETTIKLQEIIEEAKERKLITQNLLLFRFQLNRVGWLKERYLPELHQTGKIEEKIEELLYSETFRKREVERLEKNIFLISDTKNLINEYLEQTDNHELDKLLNEVKNNFDSFLEQLYSIKQQVAIGNDIFECPTIEEVYLGDVKLRLGEIPLRNSLKNLKEKLAQQLEEIHQIALKELIESAPKIYTPHNLIIFAPAGSGKTHALANVVQNRLKLNLPALIIDAQSVNSDNWKSIFVDGIGLSSNWDELEIFNALDKLGKENKDGKVLIAVDGLDEVGDYKKWKTRIDELKIYLTSYPNIRFVVACRNYGFRNPLEFDLVNVGIGNRAFSIYNFNNSIIDDLLPIYFQEYKIDVSETPWIPYTIDSALELRLFCEEYQGQKISINVSTNISSLLRQKIQRVEKNIYEEINIDWIEDDHVPQKMLIEIAKVFFLNYDSIIEREQLIDDLLKGSIGKAINRNIISQVLDYFSKHELLLKIPIQSEELIAPKTYEYRIPFQSFLDLLIATFLTTEILGGQNNVPNKLHPQQQILEFTAISLLSEHNILVGENGLWENDFDEDEIAVYQIRALSQTNFSTLENYKEWIIKRFKQSAKLRSLLLEYIIIPGARIPKFPIGGVFIHELLAHCSNVWERDIIWSGPDYGSEEFFRIGSRLLPYYSFGKIAVHPWNYELTKHDNFDGLPLILAWSLTSIENVYREHCRKELCHWAYQKPKDFIKLLNLVFPYDDPQMKEDLACVIWGVATLCKKEDSGILVMLKDWVLENIFFEEKLIELRSPIIRQTCRNVAERAFDFGLITEEEVQRVRPPYKLPFIALKLDKAGLMAGRDGIEPITHDLAWYVIKKAFENFLPARWNNNKPPKHIEKFYKNHFKLLGVNIAANYGFTLAAALAYIKKLGWNNQETIGFTEATHGSKSRICTFVEKYTWCAVHHIMGYFSDYLPMQVGYSENNFSALTDYYKILRIPNPAQLVLEKENRKISNLWLIPNDLSPNINFNKEIDKIKSWLHGGEVPDLENWLKIERNLTQQFLINDTRKWYTLYNYTDLAGGAGTLKTFISSSMCFVKEDFFEDFLNQVKEIFSYYFDFPDRIKSSPNTSVYVSPLDVCAMSWMDDVENKVQFKNKEGRTFNIFYSTAKVVDNSVEDGDAFFNIPSKFTRKLLNIIDGSNNQFKNVNGDMVSFSITNRKSFGDSQDILLVDADKLNEILKANRLKKMWFVSVFKDIGLEFQKSTKFYDRHRHLYLVWEDNHEFKRIQLLDDNYES